MTKRPKFCRSCGAPIGPDAKFCTGCGRQVGPLPDSAESGGSPKTEKILPRHRAAGGPGESPRTGQPSADTGPTATNPRDFASAVAGGISRPGIAVALITGAVALAASIVVGVLLAFTLGGNENSISGFPLIVADGSFNEVLMATAATTMARIRIYGGSTGAILPGVFALAPAGGAAAAAWWQADRTRDTNPLTRLAWGSAGAIPLAFGMLIISLLVGGTEEFEGFSAVQVVLLALLWGALGGFLGTLLAIRPIDVRNLEGPGSWGDSLYTGLRALRAPAVSLGSVLAILGGAGTLAWIYSSITRYTFEARLAPRVADSVLLSLNYAVNGAGIGMFAAFNPSPSMALPPDRLAPDELFYFLYGDDRQARIFDYQDIYPTWLFGLAVLVFCGVPIVAALYSGFSSARAVAADSFPRAAGVGALTGVLWAALLAVASVVFAVKTDIKTVFGLVLLVGALAGSLGGLLFVQLQATQSKQE